MKNEHIVMTRLSRQGAVKPQGFFKGTLMFQTSIFNCSNVMPICTKQVLGHGKMKLRWVGVSVNGAKSMMNILLKAKHRWLI